MPKPNGALLTRYQSSLSTCDARASLQSILPQQQQTGASFHVAVPALAELLYGIQILPRATRNIENWQAIEGLFTYYQIEKQDAEYALVCKSFSVGRVGNLPRLMPLWPPLPCVMI